MQPCVRDNLLHSWLATDAMTTVPQPKARQAVVHSFMPSDPADMFASQFQSHSLTVMPRTSPRHAYDIYGAAGGTALHHGASNICRTGATARGIVGFDGRWGRSLRGFGRNSAIGVDNTATGASARDSGVGGGVVRGVDSTEVATLEGGSRDGLCWCVVCGVEETAKNMAADCMTVLAVAMLVPHTQHIV